MEEEDEFHNWYDCKFFYLKVVFFFYVLKQFFFFLWNLEMVLLYEISELEYFYCFTFFFFFTKFKILFFRNEEIMPLKNSLEKNESLESESGVKNEKETN